MSLESEDFGDEDSLPWNNCHPLDSQSDEFVEAHAGQVVAFDSSHEVIVTGSVEEVVSYLQGAVIHDAIVLGIPDFDGVPDELLLAFFGRNADGSIKNCSQEELDREIAAMLVD